MTFKRGVLLLCTVAGPLKTWGRSWPCVSSLLNDLDIHREGLRKHPHRDRLRAQKMQNPFFASDVASNSACVALTYFFALFLLQGGIFFPRKIYWLVGNAVDSFICVQFREEVSLINHANSSVLFYFFFVILHFWDAYLEPPTHSSLTSNRVSFQKTKVYKMQQKVPQDWPQYTL